MTDQQAINDKSNFINACLSNLYVEQPMDAEEFLMHAKALPHLFQKERDIVLLMIDGLHFFENNDIMQEEKEEEVFDAVNTKDFWD